MEFTHKKTSEGIRSGELRLTKLNKTTRTIPTPGCLLYTRGGATPHLLLEVSKTIVDKPQAVQITLPTV